MSSTACFLATVSSVSVHFNRLRNFFRDSVSSFGFFFSFSFISFNSLRTRVYTGVWTSILPGFSDVETRRCCSVVLVYLFRITRSGVWSDPDHLLVSDRGLPCPPLYWTWVAPEWLQRTRHFLSISCLNKVISLCWWLWLLSFCQLWLAFNGLLADLLLPYFSHWCHKTCCVPQCWVVSKRCDRLRCHWWYL